MGNLEVILELLKAALWPATVIWLVWFLKDKIQNFLIKFQDAEIQLSMKKAEETKAEVDTIVHDVIQKLNFAQPHQNIGEINKLLSRIPDLAAELAAFATIESKGSNANGEFKFYKNGIVTLRITIKPGQLASGESQIVFPAAVSSDDINVTFIGEEQPLITKLNQHGMTLKVSHPNEKQIQVIVYGLRSF